MLPLAQVEFVLKHLIAKFFGDGTVLEKKMDC